MSHASTTADATTPDATTPDAGTSAGSPDTAAPEAAAGLPAVLPGVSAEVVDSLPPRLRKRLDGAVRKAAQWPRTRDGDRLRIAIDDETELVLHAPGGIVRSADDVRCGCLLAPACLHRAAAVSCAPVADADAADAGVDAEADADAGDPASQPPSGEGSPADAGTKTPPSAAAGPGGDRAGAPRSPASGSSGPAPEPQPATTGPGAKAARDSLDALREAATAVLLAGTDGSGAVAQAELLRAAHAARLAGLHRPSALAVTVVNSLRAARAEEPHHRLADLVTALTELLEAATPPPGALVGGGAGTARRAYKPAGSLRLYGLFTEPVLTATGYAGVVTWTVDGDGRLYTVGDIAPGGVARIAGSARRAVRVGDTTIDHSALSRAGLVLSGATVSADGRLGAGSGVRAVRASGAPWTGAPLAHLWDQPLSEQVERALKGADAGSDLIFLDVTLLGADGGSLLAASGTLVVRLLVAHDHPELTYWENLRLLASRPGLRLRVIGRLETAEEPRVRLLAAGIPPEDQEADPEADPEAEAGVGDVLTLPQERHGRVDLGLDRLHRTDLPGTDSAPGAGSGPEPALTAAPAPAAVTAHLGSAEEAPLHLLRRRVERAVNGGRSAIALAGAERIAEDTVRLRGAGMATAADLVTALGESAVNRGRDTFGRLLPADGRRFARTWLAAALYDREVSVALCAHAWLPDGSKEGSQGA